MRKHRFPNLVEAIGATLFILLSMFYVGTIWAQTPIDLDREILVYIQPAALQFPAVERGTVPLDRLSIPSQVLRQALNRFGVQSLAKAMPDFGDADTVRIAEDGRRISIPKFSRIFRIQVPDRAQIDSAIAALSRVPGLFFAERNMDAKLFSDPTYSNQWHLNNTGQSGGTPGADIKAEQAWQIFTGSSSIRIGIFDTGVETSHGEFTGKISGDAIDAAGSDPYWSHGTHVAGIAAAKANNDAGGRGVDWNAQIDSRKIFSGYGSYLGDAAVSNQITNSVNSGTHIMSHSWGGTLYSTTVRLAFAYAYKMNRVSVAAMGNNGTNVINYPSAFGQGIIAVGATQNNDVRSPFSTWGNHIDVTAPGGYNAWPNNDGRDIWSSWRGNSYRYLAGTSMSTPVATGIASLLKGYNFNLYNDDIENIIKLSADDKGDPGWDQYYGTGRVNAKKALDRLGSSYSLTQAFTVGGTDQGASSGYWMSIYGAVGLSDGTYWVKRHEVRQTASYPSTPNVAVWGRGVVTNGWANEGSVNFTYGFCEPVPGTVTSTSATLRTYTYEVFAYPAGQFFGWYPTTPSNVRFEYTVHGTTPFSVSISGPGSLLKGQGGTWRANVTAGSGAYSYQWYISTCGGCWWDALGTNQSQYYTMAVQDLLLRCDVHDAVLGYNASATYDVYYEGGLQKLNAETLPEKFDVHSAYPNPFNPSTQVKFDLPEDGFVTLNVFDVLGRKVGEIANGNYAAGYHTASWNATDVSSGVYFARFTVTDEFGKIKFTKINKLMLAK
jgi:hypothetical protein